MKVISSNFSKLLLVSSNCIFVLQKKPPKTGMLKLIKSIKFKTPYSNEISPPVKMLMLWTLSSLYIALSRFSVLISPGQTVLCECSSGFLTKSFMLSSVAYNFLPGWQKWPKVFNWRLLPREFNCFSNPETNELWTN